MKKKLSFFAFLKKFLFAKQSIHSFASFGLHPKYLLHFNRKTHPPLISWKIQKYTAVNLRVAQCYSTLKMRKSWFRKIFCCWENNREKGFCSPKNEATSQSCLCFLFVCCYRISQISTHRVPITEGVIAFLQPNLGLIC